MRIQHMVASVAILSTVTASLAGGMAMLRGTPSPAGADTITPIGNGCPACVWNLPVDMSVVGNYPLTVNVSGSNFTPGGTVHLTLQTVPSNNVPTPTPVPNPPSPITPIPTPAPLILASANAVASFPLDGWLPSGQHIHIVGGQITATLTAPTSPCGAFNVQIVATDVATGRTSASDPHYVARFCLH